MTIECGELKIEYSIGNLQSLEGGENFPIFHGLPQYVQKLQMSA